MRNMLLLPILLLAGCADASPEGVDELPSLVPLGAVPVEQIDFVARHGATCDVAGPGIWPDGTIAWFPITNEVTPCPAGATDCLQKVVLDLDDFPDAVCNDGSPGVMYVRVNPASSKWLVHLQQGGDCKTYQECYERWCGLNSYSASKMSTWHTPEAMSATGIFSDRAGNAFRNWNVVYGYYCSSDEWRGTAGDVVLSQVKPTTFDRMTVRFHGYAIADAIVATLQSGAVVTTAAGEELDLPDLDQAEQVVLSGSSAGAIGVRHLADDYATRLRTSNPDVDFRVVIDSTHKPVEAWAQDDLDGNCDSSPLERYDSIPDLEADGLAADAVTDAVVDASCLAAHAADPGRCANPEHVLHFHVTTPFFARQGLLEKIGDDDDDDVLDVDPELWKDAAREGIKAYEDPAFTDQLTGEVREPLGIEPGWFAPDCNTHTAIDSERFYSELASSGASSYDYETVLSNWVNGSGRRQVVQHDTAPIVDPAGFGRRSVCPGDGPDKAVVCVP